MTKRPRRRRKSDRVVHGYVGSDEQTCDTALAPFDRAANESEQKWGIDRLPQLVSPETAVIWGRTMANLNEALKAQDPVAVKDCVNSCLRGLAIMDNEATAAGHEPATGRLFEFELEPDEGEEPFRFAVLGDDMQWQTAKALRPDLLTFTKREVAIALKAYARSPLVQETKKHFPQAQIIKPNPPVNYRAGGDEIPF